jgi:hypothetical protein
MTKPQERLLAFACGVGFIIVLLVLALLVKNPTSFQYQVFRIVLALAAGGFAGLVDGFLTISFNKWLKAGGALAVFVIVYFYNPAQLVKSPEEVEIDKPIVGVDIRSSHGFIATAQASEKPENLSVRDPAALTSPSVLSKRYGTVTVDRASVWVPPGSTLVANDIFAINGGSLVGTDFSVVARRMANLTIDVSEGIHGNTSAGSVRLYVKAVQNDRILARGADGVSGANGNPGSPGTNGSNGRDGKCDGFGGYRGADGGGNGGNGGNGDPGHPGGDGHPGGFVQLMTIATTAGTTIDVEGGAAGTGGQGGSPGTPGAAGHGGRGCTGLGGSQPSQSDGNAGQPGARGEPGPAGRHGARGEPRILMVKTFDPIVEKLQHVPNERLNDELQRP